MNRRFYYSARTGENPEGSRYSLPMLKRLFLAVYNDLLNRELFQEFLGKDCPDDQYSYGTAGQNIGMFFLRKLKKENLWPIHDRLEHYSEGDLFDVIELLHDHASAGLEGRMHNFGGCGMHYTRFDSEAGRAEFRGAINEILGDYSTGFEISESGEIVRLPEAGFENLFDAPTPHADPKNVTNRVAAAVRRYRSRQSTLEDRRIAVRSLIDVLEYLRPQLKAVFASKDEADLFNIANNFGLRHHNDKQRTDYDPNIWTSWMFYFYLATVHTALRLIERHDIE